MCDIRKLVDTTNPNAVDEQLQREHRYRRYVLQEMPSGPERRKLVSQSKRRTKQLQQAYDDYLFADSTADLKYGRD